MGLIPQTHDRNEINSEAPILWGQFNYMEFPEPDFYSWEILKQ